MPGPAQYPLANFVFSASYEQFVPQQRTIIAFRPRWLQLIRGGSDVLRSQRDDCGRGGYIKRICGRVGLGRSYAAERTETALAAPITAPTGNR
jgi:hypothetical protein